jgi:hypothetical protein
MKRLMMTIAFVTLTIAATTRLAHAQTVAPSTDAENLAALHKQFTAELKKLRLEVLQQGIEFQEWKIKQLERELQQVVDKRQRLEEESHVIHQQLAELEDPASNSTHAEAGQVSELDAIKANLIGEGQEKLLAARQAIAQQEADLTGLLKQEQARLQGLLKSREAEK